MSVEYIDRTIQLNSGLIIPASAAAGYVLTSDASGNATWQAPSGGGGGGSGVSSFDTRTGTVTLTEADVLATGIANANINFVNNWDSSIKAALAASGSSLARVALVGDSLTQGAYASNLLTTSWAAILTAALQTAYGDGGSGFRSPACSSTWLSAFGIPGATLTAWEGNGSIVLPVGTWTTFTADAIFGSSIKTTDLATPASYTTTVRGTTIKIYTIGNNGTNASCTYQIDGGSIITITDTATGGLQPVVTTISGLSSGNHTVKITYTGDGTKVLYLGGIEGRNATGVVVDNFGSYGILASQMASQTAFVDSPASIQADWLGGFRHPADLVIWSLGANDAHTSVTGVLFNKYLRQMITRIKDYLQTNASPIVNTNTEGNVSILIVMPHIGAYDSASAANYVWQDYVAAATATAKSYGATLVNFWADGKTSWNYWKSLGYWGNPASPGAAGSDFIHLGDTGHAHIASVLDSIVP